MRERAGPRLFGVLVLLQAAHSLEEYWFRLYDVLLPTRIVSGLFSSDLALGFALANSAIVLWIGWCHFYRVRAGHRSGRAWAWFWTLLEGANGAAHLIDAAQTGGYFPGAATAPALLIVAAALARALTREPAARR